MPGHRLEWAIVGLILVLIGLNSGAQYFREEKSNLTNLFSETEGSPQATQNSSGLKWCSPSCPVLLSKECCLNPICKRKKREACRWTDYLKPENTNTKGWSVQKQNSKDYTGCVQVFCRNKLLHNNSHQKNSKCQNFLRIWHLVIFRAEK